MTAVVRARGDYVLFMDSADYANPDAVATFVEAAGRTGADVLTCFLVLFSGRPAQVSLGQRSAS